MDRLEDFKCVGSSARPRIFEHSERGSLNLGSE